VLKPLVQNTQTGEKMATPDKKTEFDFFVSGVSPFMAQVAKGLKAPGAHVPHCTKDKSLGDRSTYVGASSANGCLYKAYQDAMDKPDRIDSKQIFVFERGHQLEEMIRKGLNGLGWMEIDSVADYKPGTQSVVHQEEVVGEGKYSFIKAHIDFVFVGQKVLVVKEIKSSATLPHRPWNNHIGQTMIQAWLLKAKYPERKVRASVVYHNWDTGESVDYPVEFNEATLKGALDSALLLWNAYKTKQVPKPTVQPYCSKCPYKGSCPALCFGAETDLPEEFAEIVQRLYDMKLANRSMEKLKLNLMTWMVSAGLKKMKASNDIYVEVANGQNGQYLKII
jgi:CRISPR-associated exonuclease Cas4